MLKIILLCIFCAGTCAAQSIPVILGNTSVSIEYHSGLSPMYVHLHQNETTALKAIKKAAGKNAWLSLRHSGGRTIVFNLQGERYEFDPNRMFTKRGIQMSLSQYSHYSREASEEVDKLATRIKALIKGQPVIAVHNNRGYSFRDYLPGHPLARDIKYLAFPHPAVFRNFFLVTQHADYVNLKSRKVNVIEQQPAAQDDGSLSIYLSHATYINVEAGYNQLAAQQKMLQQARALFA